MSPITDDDLDRLADYTAGLLEPTEAAEIDRLIATDDGWARAHDALVAAQPLVDRALAGLPEERMPADVVARINRALDGAAIGPAPVGGTASNVIDLGRARRWRRAALATTAVAAAVAACVGGVAALNGARSTTHSNSTSAGRAASAPKVTQDAGAAPTILVSGTDYTHVQLATPPARPGRAYNASAPSGAAAQAPNAAGSAGRPEADTATVAAELARLTDPTQLRACLDAIVAVDRGQPTSVDYARYKGAPALIVTLAVGPVTAVAVGPSCGLPGAGAAIIDSAG